MRIALGALGVAVGDDGVDARHARSASTRFPTRRSTTVASLEGNRRAVRSARRPTSQATVDNDLFSADRSAPAAPYRMPGETDPNDKTAAQPRSPSCSERQSRPTDTSSRRCNSVTDARRSCMSATRSASGS